MMTVGPGRIQQFWHWWETCSHRDAASLDQQVRSLDPGLAWELDPGNTLTVHANGSPTLRALAARWAAAAPATPGWTFLPARPPSPVPLSVTVTTDGVRIPLPELRFTAEPAATRPELDVTAIHPAFATIPGTSARCLADLALNEILGDTRTDAWIGQISTTPEPSASVTAAALLRLVDTFASAKRWQTWTNLPDGAARWPLRPARWPRFDTHLTITLPANRDPRPTADPTTAWSKLSAPRTARPTRNVTPVGHRTPRPESQGSTTIHWTPARETTLQKRSSPLGWTSPFPPHPAPGSQPSTARTYTPDQPRTASPPTPTDRPSTTSSPPAPPSAACPSTCTPAAQPSTGFPSTLTTPPDQLWVWLERVVDPDGVLVAWEDNGRVAHFYVDGATDAPALVEAAVGRGAVIERGYDPTLADVRHLAAWYPR